MRLVCLLLSVVVVAEARHIADVVRGDVEEAKQLDGSELKGVPISEERLAQLREIAEEMGPREESILSYNEHVGVKLVDGDILVPQPEDASRSKRHSFNIAAVQWDPSQRINYMFQNKLTSESQNNIRKVIRKLEAQTCLRFAEVYDKSAYTNGIHFIDNGACYSNLGKLRWDWNTISLPNSPSSCQREGTIFHEIFHALGFVHTHSRNDRDHHIRVVKENIIPEYWSQFISTTTNNSMPYDYGSALHYSNRAGSLSAAHVAVDPIIDLYDFTIGQREGPSFYDIAAVNSVYRCSDHCYSNARTAKCENGGYPHPNDCEKCVCPRGFDGVTCAGIENGGRKLTATEALQHATLDAGTTYWIEAPCGKQVLLTFDEREYDMTCMESCEEGYWNVKLADNPRESGYRVCCRSQFGKPIYSQKNMVVLSPGPTVGKVAIRYKYD